MLLQVYRKYISLHLCGKFDHRSIRIHPESTRELGGSKSLVASYSIAPFPHWKETYWYTFFQKTKMDPENRPENRQGTSFQTFNFVRKHVNCRGPTHIRCLICIHIYIYHLLTSRTYRGRRLQVWWRSMRYLYVAFLDPGYFDDWWIILIGSNTCHNMLNNKKRLRIQRFVEFTTKSCWSQLKIHWISQTSK